MHDFPARTDTATISPDPRNNPTHTQFSREFLEVMHSALGFVQSFEPSPHLLTWNLHSRSRCTEALRCELQEVGLLQLQRYPPHSDETRWVKFGAHGLTEWLTLASTQAFTTAGARSSRGAGFLDSLRKSPRLASRRVASGRLRRR